MTKRLFLFFGGRSSEHEVSVVSALQACKHLDSKKYQTTLVYTSKSGQFYIGDKLSDIKNYKNIDSLLRSCQEVIFVTGGLQTKSFFSRQLPIDIALPIYHGSFGEDGSIQGVFEIFQIPYCGFNVLGSAVAMDKIMAKQLFENLGLPVGKYVYFSRYEFWQNQKQVLAKIKKLKYPLFVKPADIGSTIGINKAENETELTFNIDVAANYSDKILVEESFNGLPEVNCAAVGYKQVISSVCEMPIKKAEFLSFEDKYLRGGKSKSGKSSGMASLDRQIPAPISKQLAKDIAETTIKVFKELEGCGVARIDFFVDPKKEKYWINEVNTPPGSLAFYLFEPMGIHYTELLDRIIEAGLERFADNQKTTFTFDTPLLSMQSE